MRTEDTDNPLNEDMNNDETMSGLAGGSLYDNMS